MSDSSPRLVRFVQPLLPKYREALCAALAGTPGITLEVWADLQPRQGSLKGAASHRDFVCVHKPYREIGPFIWQPGELSAVARPADVVIMPWNSRYVQLIPALLRGRLNGVRTILFGHGLGKRESWLRRRFRNALIGLSDACILYSQGQADSLLAEGHSPSKIFVAPNSVDPKPIVDATSAWPREKVDVFLAERGCTRGKTLLYISRLERWKRVDMLLRAVAMLAPNEPRMKAAIIGDGEDRSRLEALARELGVADRVLFVGALYDEMDIAPWMLGSSCLAFPAAIGLSMLHALNYGLPVITSDDRLPHGPEIEALRHGENGYLYRDGDINAFAEAIGRVVGDESLQIRLGAAALATVTGPNAWNLDSMVRGFLAAIRG
ncbi:MAG: glycosyltransferase family 4 protein [Phycisphaerae bacterium]|jgi:glycosyltransferase involved in cell wall biosynthesis|nr:glycosyltransferase family 4 protein [Phycisphaerae bacterium]